MLFTFWEGGIFIQVILWHLTVPPQFCTGRHFNMTITCCYTYMYFWPFRLVYQMYEYCLSGHVPVINLYSLSASLSPHMSLQSVDMNYMYNCSNGTVQTSSSWCVYKMHIQARIRGGSCGLAAPIPSFEAQKTDHFRVHFNWYFLLRLWVLVSQTLLQIFMSTVIPHAVVTF